MLEKFDVFNFYDIKLAADHPFLQIFQKHYKPIKSKSRNASISTRSLL